MPTIDPAASALLIVDFQSRLMPAIEHGEAIVAQARRLLKAAEIFAVPVVFTEQNAAGLGPTVPELAAPTAANVVHKMSFDACRTAGFLECLADRRDIVVAGCETHVCVLQTVLGLVAAGRRVYLVRDAVGSRRAGSKETAIRRMERHGVEIVTTEMVVFEWLATAERPELRAAIALVK